MFGVRDNASAVARVLGVGAQLIDVLGPRALQADHEAAAEGNHQEQTDSDQQLFEQRHLSACS